MKVEPSSPFRHKPKYRLYFKTAIMCFFYHEHSTQFAPETSLSPQITLHICISETMMSWRKRSKNDDVPMHLNVG